MGNFVDSTVQLRINLPPLKGESSRCRKKSALSRFHIINIPYKGVSFKHQRQSLNMRSKTCTRSLSNLYRQRRPWKRTSNGSVRNFVDSAVRLRINLPALKGESSRCRTKSPLSRCLIINIPYKGVLCAFVKYLLDSL